MFLRSASRNSPNKLNSSRGRGKKIETPPRKSFDDLQIVNPSRPLVVHSPPRCSSVPIPFIDNEYLNSNPNTGNILQDDSSVPVALTTSSNISLRQTCDLLGFEFEDRTSANNIMPSTGNIENSTGNDNMDSNTLLTVLQNIRETQANFTSELSSLRQSVSTLSQNSANPSMPPPVINDNHNSAHAGHSAVSERRDKIDFEKWKVTFDGTGNVSDFLFKIDTLVERTRCSVDQLQDNFQIFLKGRAETWYWQYIAKNNDPPYRLIKRGLKNEFATFDTDDDILLQINLRKQHPKESYDDFHSAILSLNSRMSESLTDSRLINILKKNVNSELRLMLFNSDSGDLQSLRDLARKAERVLKENKAPMAPKISSRHVNEMEIETPKEEDSDYEFDPQLEAIQFSKPFSKPDYSRIKCWNCLSLGHSYIYCPEESRAIFCYKCGQRGVVTTKCGNPHTGNKKRSEMVTGDSRSRLQTPST